MRKILKIFIILTPFQFEMMNNLFYCELRNRNSVVFYKDIVFIQTNDFESVLIKLNFKEFLIRTLLKKPIFNIPLYRKKVREIQNYCELFLNSFFFTNRLEIVIGNDNDNFTQILLNKIYKSKKKNTKLIAVEEGFGYYNSDNKLDFCKAFFYEKIAIILFSERLKYRKQLGTDDRINKVYARLPHLIPKKKNKIEYIKIPTKKRPSLNLSKLENLILIFSFPNQDIGIDDKKKKDFFLKIIKKYNRYEIYVKPHPRESTLVFEEINGIRLMNKNVIAERINYFKFKKIIHFSSSVVIDILAQGYPKENVYTIKMSRSRFELFEETNCINLKDL